MVQMQDYADYKVMTQEDRRKLFSLLQVLKRELDGAAKPPAQVRYVCPSLRACPACFSHTPVNSSLTTLPAAH